MKRLLFTLSLSLAVGLGGVNAQDRYDAPQNGNPILPGYFADPTIKKFGDTYYIYATTDGSGAGFGPSQVWTSKNLVDWTVMPMNWPDSHWIWAPDVMRHSDGKYYMVYCQPCTLHCGVAETPRGPWQNILGKSDAVWVADRFVKNAITLDGQTFVDDDGTVYCYWGTWGIYKDFGCGVGKVNSKDFTKFDTTRLIVNTEATDFFEAPFVFKRGKTYYFTYSSGSCHDSTYRVQYAVSKSPMGPYKYKGCILQSTADGTVHGPGHHSILVEDGKYYIIYHRHDNPHSNRGFHRQICADVLEFDNRGNILLVKPSHKGVFIDKSGRRNLALGAKVSASSFYDHNFRPNFAVDDNNGTLWRPKTTGQEYFVIDLGNIQRIRTIQTQFEYATQFYQYVLETSNDGKTWQMFADKSSNKLSGSPMNDFGDVNARYIRFTYLNGEKLGYGGAVWNFKVFSDLITDSPQQWLGFSAADFNGFEWANNYGILGGRLVLVQGQAQKVFGDDGRAQLRLMPNTVLEYRNPLISNKIFVPGNNKCVKIMDGVLRIENNTSNPVIINDLIGFNWQPEKAEQDYFSTLGIQPKTAAPTFKTGSIVDITADDFNVGDTAFYVENHGVDGYFEAKGKPLVVASVDGKKAFHFTGEEVYLSSFAMPNTLRDNAPYILEAEFLNPEMELNECIADFTSTHDELEKIMLVNGTEPRCGIFNHYGWYEDAGLGKDNGKKYENQWVKMRVEFDGRIEKIYMNGTLVSQKDLQLMVKPSQFVTLGRNAEGDWPFKGYLRSIQLSNN